MQRNPIERKDSKLKINKYEIQKSAMGRASGFRKFLFYCDRRL
jgi:hypothetical protein